MMSRIRSDRGEPYFRSEFGNAAGNFSRPSLSGRVSPYGPARSVGRGTELAAISGTCTFSRAGDFHTPRVRMSGRGALRRHSDRDDAPIAYLVILHSRFVDMLRSRDDDEALEVGKIGNLTQVWRVSLIESKSWLAGVRRIAS